MPTRRPPSSTNGIARASCCSTATHGRRGGGGSRQGAGASQAAEVVVRRWGALRRSPFLWLSDLPMTAISLPQTGEAARTRSRSTAAVAQRPASRCCSCFRPSCSFWCFASFRLFWGFGISLTSATATSPGEFIGAGNYLRALDDPNFRASIVNAGGGAAFGAHLRHDPDVAGDPDRPGRSRTRVLPLRLFLSGRAFERDHRLHLQRRAGLQRKLQRRAQGCSAFPAWTGSAAPLRRCR